PGRAAAGQPGLLRRKRDLRVRRKLVLRLLGNLIPGLQGEFALRLLGKLVHGLLGRLVGLPGGAACPPFSHVDQPLSRRTRDLANLSAGVERRRPTAWPSTWATS